MKDQIRLAIIGWAVLAAGVSAVCAEEAVRVGIYDCGPLVCTDHRSEDNGIMVALLRAVSEAEGWEIVPVPGPLADHLEALRQDEIDLLAAAPLPEERRRPLSFTREGILSTWGRLFVAPGLQVGSLMELNGLTLAVVRGDPYGAALRELVTGLGLDCEFIWMNHYHEVFRALAWGRVAAGAVDRLFGAEQADRYGVTRTPIVFEPREFGYAAPDSPEGRRRIRTLDNRLAAMRADPDSPYHQLLARAVHPQPAPGLPLWLRWSGALGVGLLLLVGGVALLLRRRVRAQTRELQRKNAALWEEIAMRREAETSLRRQKKYLESLREMSMGIVRHLDPDMLLDRILARAVELAGADVGFLYLHQAEEDALILRAGVGACAGHVGIRRSPTDGLAGAVHQSGRPLVLEDYAAWDGRLPDPPYQGIRAVAGIPLISGERVFGVLGVGSGRPGPRFDPELIETLRHFARLSAVAMDNAFLHDRLQRELAGRKRAEQRLRESRDRFQEVLDAVPAGIVLVDAATLRVAYANPAAEEMAGEPRGALTGRSCEGMLCAPGGDCPNCWPSSMEPRAPAPAECILATAGGARVPILKTAYPARLDGHAFLVESFIDLRELKAAEARREELESALQEARRMESLGVLAGGVAHDFKNILTPIMGHAEMALRRAPRQGEGRRHLEEVLRAARRAKDLTRQILSFSRKEAGETEEIDANPVVEEVLRLLEATLPAGITLHSDLSPDPLPVAANATQLHQLVMNLCTNAGQAMAETGGVLTVSTGRERTAEGAWVHLTVADTGRGMPPEVRDRLFEPYFTTRGHSEGTGLGMSVVHGIVASRGGRIEVDSAPGRGTRIQARLPLVADATSALPASATMAPPAGASENRILLVDDDPLVTEVQAEILTGFGFQVTAFRDGAAALRRFRAGPEDFDLVISDRSMPRLDGEALAREIQVLRPGLPMLFCTGSDEGLSPETARRLSIRECLRKPVPAGELVGAARRLLQAGPMTAGVPPPRSGGRLDLERKPAETG
jgi:signal transduction histidine kinase/CheY-like chemotaxis protein/ABC-type amino acid transport substrate-binding protein/putative methionine-R-sulfoxide reductase with GAF domain